MRAAGFPHHRRLLAALVLIAVLGGVWAFWPPSESATEKTSRMLQEIMIPRFELHEATVDEALDFLTNAVRAQGISEQRFRFRHDIERDQRPLLEWVELHEELQPDGSQKIVEKVVDGFPAPPIAEVPGLEPIQGIIAPPLPPSRSTSHDSRISVDLTDIPLIEALKYVTSLADLRYRVQGSEILLFVKEPRPRGPLIESKRYVPRSILIRAGLPSNQQPPVVDRRLFFQSAGIHFCRGSKAEYLPETETLVTLLPEDEDGAVEALVTPSCTGSWKRPTLLDRIRAWLHGETSS